MAPIYRRRSAQEADALQRQLHADGYGHPAKNMKEVGDALKLAWVEKLRKTENGSKHRFYRLPEGARSNADDEEYKF
jgi:hypothetical protein